MSTQGDDSTGKSASSNESTEKPRRIDPLHGITLKAMIEHLVERYGWDGLGKRIEIRSFTHEPSVNSSLKFLRKTPWARAKVESLYLHSAAHPRKSVTPAAVVEPAQADEQP